MQKSLSSERLFCMWGCKTSRRFEPGRGQGDSNCHLHLIFLCLLYDRTYLPVRVIANALGVSNENIAWDAETSTATLVK